MSKEARRDQPAGEDKETIEIDEDETTEAKESKTHPTILDEREETGEGKKFMSFRNMNKQGAKTMNNITRIRIRLESVPRAKAALAFTNK